MSFERISLVRCLLPLLYHPIPSGEGSSKAEFWLQISKFIKHGASKKKQDKYPVVGRYHYQTGHLHLHQKWPEKSKTVELESDFLAEQSSFSKDGETFYPSYHRHFYITWLTTAASLKRDFPSGCTQGCNVFNTASCLTFSSLSVTGPQGQPDPGQKFWRTLGVNTFKCEMKRALLDLRGHVNSTSTNSPYSSSFCPRSQPGGWCS